MNEIARFFASQLWAMDEGAYAALIGQVSSFDQAAIDSVLRVLAEKPELLARIAQRDGTAALNPNRSAASAALSVRDGVAHIPISGTMMKQVPCMLDMLGVQATSTEAVREQVAAAVENSGVRSIVLDIDSPGGTVDGTAALAEDVRAVRGLKPIEAHVSDRAASAAYWVAAQTDRIVASPTSSVGSIGVFGVVPDSSEAAAKAGVKVNVISSHELKGAGVPGAPVTDAQIADMRRNIETLSGLFVDAVASGRGLSAAQARELATGQVWIGDEAKANGLVDHVQHAQKRSQKQNFTAAPTAKQEKQMDPKETAELEQLRAEVSKLKAKAEADAAIAEARKAQDIKALVAKYADRVPPSASAKVEAFVASLDAAEAESYLSELPKIVRDTPAPAPAVQGPATQTFSEVEEMSAKRLGSTPARLAFFRTVESRFADGSAQMRDGRILSKAAFEKLIPALALLVTLFAGSTASATALQAARATQCKGAGNTKSYLMADSTAIYAGGMVMVNSSGLAAPAAASASNHGVVGIATETKTSAATGTCVNGTCTIPVQEAWCKFAGTTLGQEDVGNLVYAEDDQTVDDSAGANEPVAGMLVQYVSSSVGWVHLSSIYTVRDAVSDPLTLTGDFTGGGGAGAVTLTDSASSILIPNNDTTALDIGSSGLTNAMRFSTATGLETVLFTAGVGNAAGSITTDTTLDASDCGKPQFVTAAFDTHTITLPALSAVPAGCLLRIMYVGADAGALLDISPNAADGIEGGCTLAASVVNFSGTDDADVGITKATIQQGDFLTLISGNTDDWYTVGAQGICANN